MKQMRWTTFMVVVLIAVITVAGAACSSEEPNQLPSMTSLVADPASLAPGDGSTVTCVASDPDGDALSYDWTCNGGAISGMGAEVTWVAPSVAKTYTVGVTVSDGNGGVANQSISIVVAVPMPTPTPTAAPSDGSIDIKSGSIDGAKVIIDGVDTGSVTPYVATHVSVGNHTVKLELPYYKWRIETVTVIGGETTYINWALEVASIQSVTLQPDAAAGKDAYTYEFIPGNNYGDTPLVYTDANVVGTQIRTYIQFNLSSLPSTAVITGAWCELYYTYTSAAVPAAIGAYQVMGSWTELDPSGITWNNQPAIATSAEYIVTLPAAVTNGFVSWYIADLAERWQHGSIPNYGMALADTDPSTAEAWKGFSSSDNGVAAQNPRLIINYYDPATP
jgi:hypothetical protein